MSIEPCRALEEKCLAYCRAQALFHAGDTVIAACSGGADSVAMLLFLLRCQEELGIRLLAAHLDHGIRGQASQADAAFVAKLCQEKGLELLTFDAVANGVQVPRRPSEDWARRLRYGWFDTLAAQYGAKIATAHTMTDQAETLLFRLARGSGIHGAGGIPPRRGPYVRPFLCLTRAETEAYCHALGQAYVQDASNADMRYARNGIRHQALPALLNANPAALQAMDRFAADMREWDAYLGTQADAVLKAAQTENGYRCAVLRAAAPPLRREALYRLLARHMLPSRRKVELLYGLLAAGQGSVQLAPDVRAVCGQTLFLEFTGELTGQAPAAPMPAAPQAALPGVYHLPGGYVLELAVELHGKYEKFIKNVVKTKKGLNCCADYDKIDRNLMLRTRCPGDRFYPHAHGGHKTLKKYLNEQGIPPQQRALLPLLTVGNEVVWVWGCGFGAPWAPDSDTQRVLLARMMDGPDELDQ